MHDDDKITITISNKKAMEAKRSKIFNWKVNRVFEEVEWEGQPIISLRWVITEIVQEV